MRRAEPRRERGLRAGIVLQRLVLFFSAKSLVIPAVVEGGRRTRAERISGLDVCEFGVSGRT